MRTVMTSLNTINSIPTSVDKISFKEILKVEEDTVDKDSKVIFNDDGTITIQNLDLLDKIGTGLINMRRNEILNQQHLS